MSSEDLDTIVAPLLAAECPDCLVKVVRERAIAKASEAPNNCKTLRMATSYIIAPVLKAVPTVVATAVKSNFLEYFGKWLTFTHSCTNIILKSQHKRVTRDGHRTRQLVAHKVF